MTLQERIAVSTVPEPYRFNQRDYLLLDRSGAFDAYSKTELIEGVIVAVNAQYSQHARVQTFFLRKLADACDALDTDFGAWVELTVSVSERSMPQPDIVVSRGLPTQGPVQLASVMLIVEVADISLRNDLDVKSLLYASAGIPEYWVVDVNGRIIHQMWAPRERAYTAHQDVAFGEHIEAATMSGLVIQTSLL